jgi:iron complex outermembrane recepter protein
MGYEQMKVIRPVLLAVSLALAGPAVAQHSTQTLAFAIEKKRLPEALAQWAQATGLQVISQAEIVRHMNANPVVGNYTPMQALQLLLANTDLTFTTVGDHTISIERAQPEPTVRQTGVQFQRLAAAPSANEVATGSVGMSSPSSSNTAQSTNRPVQEEIIVTAQKRSERLQDVPVPVTVINTDMLVAGNKLRVQDYYTRIPGLSLTLIGDGSAPTVAIRGVTTGGLTNPTVGVVVDDVPYGATVTSLTAPSVPDIEPGDLARVEVLRGPQGTLYGASSMGGLLKYMTIDPNTTALTGKVQAGTTSVEDGEVGFNARAAVNVPLSDEFAIRLSGFKTRDPGYVDNVQTGSDDINRRDNEGGRISALWRPSDALTVKLSALAQESLRRGTSDVDSRLGSELQQSALRNTGEYGRDTKAFTATIIGDLGGVELTSISGYNIDKIDTRIDQSAAFGGFARANFQVSGVAGPLHREIDKVSQELRASIPLGDRVQWLVGAFYTDEESSLKLDYLAVDPTSGAAAGSLFTNDQPTEFREYAAFTNVTVTLTERFDIQFGGRYSENEQSFSSVRTGPLAVLFFGRSPSAVPEVSGEDSAFTYLLTPRFRINDDLMFYGRVASGYRPGGPNAACGAAGIACNYDADTTTNYELGFKGAMLEGALALDASVYYIDWSDIQILLTDRATNLQYVANAAEAKSQGAELALDVRPLSGLTLTASAAWNDAELTQGFPSAPNIFGRAGDRLPYSSRLSGSLSITQEFPLGTVADGFVEGVVSYVGDRKGTFRSTAVRETFPSYTQLDFRLGATYDQWTVDLFVNNATDERGVLRSGLESLRPTFLTYTQPRTLGMSITRTF